jgi:hypothetical protein
VKVKRIFGNVLGWNSTPRGSGESVYDQQNPDYIKGLLTKPGYQAEVGTGDTWPVNMDDCEAGNSAAYYSPLDSLGRATGARACLTDGDFGWVDGKTGEIKGNADSWLRGTPVPRRGPGAFSNPLWNPPGVAPGMDRAHLLANRTGGTGLDRRNLTPLYSDVNHPDMWNAVEKGVIGRLNRNDTMYYEVSVSYSGDSLVPDRLSYFWKDITTGQSDDGYILNTP